MSMVAELDALIDELTVDAYGDEEQLSGFHVGAEERLRRGERATTVGVDVEIVAVDCGPVQAPSRSTRSTEKPAPASARAVARPAMLPRRRGCSRRPSESAAHASPR
jgi:hypothetical protein